MHFSRAWSPDHQLNRMCRIHYVHASLVSSGRRMKLASCRYYGLSSQSGLQYWKFPCTAREAPNIFVVCLKIFHQDLLKIFEVPRLVSATNFCSLGPFWVYLFKKISKIDSSDAICQYIWESSDGLDLQTRSMWFISQYAKPRQLPLFLDPYVLLFWMRVTQNNNLSKHSCSLHLLATAKYICVSASFQIVDDMLLLI